MGVGRKRKKWVTGFSRASVTTTHPKLQGELGMDHGIIQPSILPSVEGMIFEDVVSVEPFSLSNSSTQLSRVPHFLNCDGEGLPNGLGVAGNHTQGSLAGEYRVQTGPGLPFEIPVPCLCFSKV